MICSQNIVSEDKLSTSYELVFLITQELINHKNDPDNS